MTTGHYVCGVKRKIDRQDILNTGRDLMFLYGYGSTGIKNITDEINIPKGSFYNHFKSKEEFALEILQQYVENGAKQHELTLLDSTVEPLQRIDNFYTGLIAYYKEVEAKYGCIMGNFSQELADVNENFRTRLDKAFEAMQKVIALCLDDAKAEGEIKGDIDSKRMAGFIHNSWQGAMLRMKATANVEPLEDFKTYILQLLKS